MTTQAVVVVTAYMRGNIRPQLHFSSPRVRDLQANPLFGYNMYGDGAMGLRQLLPAGKELHKLIPADGQMDRSSIFIWTGSL